MCGTYLGDSYYVGSFLNKPEYAPYCQDFEAFVAQIVRRAGVQPAGEILGATPNDMGAVYIKMGRSGDRRVVFVFFRDQCASVRLRFPAGTFRARARDITTGESVPMIPASKGEEYHLACPECEVRVLVHDL